MFAKQHKNMLSSLKVKQRQLTIVLIIAVAYLLMEKIFQPPTRLLQNKVTCENGKEMLNSNEELFISANLFGGLGNQMFMYAALYGTAKKTRRKPYACVDYDLSILFPKLMIPLYSKDECKKMEELEPQKYLKLKQHNGAHYYDPTIYQDIMNTNHTNVVICCYFQNLGFFLEYFQDLKKEFSLDQKHRQKARDYLDSQMELYRNRMSRTGSHVSSRNKIQIVGIHVRMGIPKLKKLMTPQPSYYKQAMDFFRQKYNGHVLFVVSTDDPKWCHENVEIGPDVVITADSGNKTMEEDFSIQVLCDHTIMSIGTFGWWIGFLTKGTVITFKDWQGSSMPGKYYLPRQRFPADWILL